MRLAASRNSLSVSMRSSRRASLSRISLSNAEMKSRLTRNAFKNNM